MTAVVNKSIPLSVKKSRFVNLGESTMLCPQATVNSIGQRLTVNPPTSAANFRKSSTESRRTRVVSYNTCNKSWYSLAATELHTKVIRNLMGTSSGNSEVQAIVGDRPGPSLHRGASSWNDVPAGAVPARNSGIQPKKTPHSTPFPSQIQ